MLAEALSWYLESLVAFWSGIARGGVLRLLVVGLILWWIFGRKCRCWSACPRCGCWCGHCRCREVDPDGRATGPDDDEVESAEDDESGSG